MTLQVLVATMHQPRGNYSLLERMNIQSDAIVCNQCDRNEFEEFVWKGHNIKWLSFAERGVGLNRNNALMRATADILLFADDDVIYEDDYPAMIISGFEQNKKADAIVFNMKESRHGEALHDRVKRTGRTNRKGLSSYATFLIAVKNIRVKERNIVFHRMFGGGTEYSCGEDTIFLQECVKRGLRVYTSTITIGKVYHGESTWYSGINDKYFVDKGVLYNYLYPRLSKVLCLYHVIKHRKMYNEYGLYNAVMQMWLGTKGKEK